MSTLSKSASAVSSGHAANLLARAKEAATLAAAKQAGSVPDTSSVTATDPNDKGTVTPSADGGTGSAANLPAGSATTTNANGGPAMSTPTEAQRQSEVNEGTPAVTTTTPCEGSPLLNKYAAVGGIDLNAAVKAAGVAAAKVAGVVPAVAAAPAAPVTTVPAKVAGSDNNAVASDFNRVAFQKIAHEMLQSESGRAAVQGWLRTSYAEKKASELFAEAKATSDGISQSEKSAHVALVKLASEFNTVNSKDAGLRDYAFSLHCQNLRAIEAGVVKFAKEQGLSQDQAVYLFTLEKDAYVKGANDMQAALEATPQDGAGEMPPLPEESPQVSPQDLIAAVQEAVQKGELPPEIGEAILQELAAQAQGGDAGAMPPEGGAPVEAPIEGGAPAEAPPEEAPEGEKAASAIDSIITGAFALAAAGK